MEHRNNVRIPAKRRFEPLTLHFIATLCAVYYSASFTSHIWPTSDFVLIQNVLTRLQYFTICLFYECNNHKTKITNASACLIHLIWKKKSLHAYFNLWQYRKTWKIRCSLLNSISFKEWEVRAIMFSVRDTLPINYTTFLPWATCQATPLVCFPVVEWVELLSL